LHGSNKNQVKLEGIQQLSRLFITYACFTGSLRPILFWKSPNSLAKFTITSVLVSAEIWFGHRLAGQFLPDSSLSVDLFGLVRGE